MTSSPLRLDVEYLDDHRTDSLSDMGSVTMERDTAERTNAKRDGGFACHRDREVPKTDT